MSEAGLFRQYAKEAMHGASKATSGNEKRPSRPRLYLGASSVDEREGVGIKLYFVAAPRC